MIVKEKAQNGKILIALKSYDELTKEELSNLIIPAGKSKDDYLLYEVKYNKKGKALVIPYKLKEAEKSALLFNLGSLTFADEDAKDYQSAKKYFYLSDEEANIVRAFTKLLTEMEKEWHFIN